MMSAIDSDLFNWIILPSLIFFARVTDVSIGTLRITYITRGKKRLAAILGFIEVLIWLLAIRQIFNNLNNFVCYLTYAGGFASGSFLGMWLEHKLAVGMQVIRIITRKDASQLIEKLRANGYGVTIIDGEGVTGHVNIIFSIIQRKDLPEIRTMIKRFNPRSFFSVEDVRMATEGIFPNNGLKHSTKFWKLMKFARKGK